MKDKYGKAALAGDRGRQRRAAAPRLARGECDPDHLEALRGERDRRAARPRPAPPRSAAATRPPSPSSTPGETVLDLGSGGGIDVLLSARRVGPTGKAYGLDMTDEMLALARENQRKAGVDNVEFLKGEIEEIPLPDNSVDVIISNCVINLSADKDRVLAEAFRVLKPGRAVRRVGRRRARRGARRDPAQHGAVDRVRGRRARGGRVSRASSPRPASRASTSSPRASIAWRTRASSSTGRGSTPTAIAPRWTASS